MTKPRYTLAALALCAVAGSASAAGSWTRTVLQPSQPPVLVSAADGNLARFAHTQVSATRSANAQWLANGMLELREGADVVYSMYTGDRAVFEFAAEARLDELRFHTSWDNGRNDFGFASVDVRDAAGEWTVLENSALALESTGSSGNTYVFADVSGDPLATGVMAVRIVLGNVENGWGGVAEIELLGGFLGTRTVTFCDADGTPLADVPPQTVPTGGAAADPRKLCQTKPTPADFEAFWAKRKAELAAVPMTAKLEEIASPTPGVKLYKVSITCAGPRPSTGYLSIPEAPGKYPATVGFHGYGASWGANATNPPKKVPTTSSKAKGICHPS